MHKWPLVGLVMATHLEAKPFIEGLGGSRTTIGPFTAYRNESMVLVISGLGQANAAMACACLCMQYIPSCIVNIGAAGANTANGFALGSIYQVSGAVQPDRLHFRTGEPFCLEPGVLPGFPTARVATRDQAVVAPESRREMARLAELSDMEGAAVVQAARKFKIPCFLFKFVSDTPADGTDQEIPNNIRCHRDALYTFFTDRVLPELLRRL